MASGTPIVCSDRRPMPDILGEGGLYFDPEKPETIEAAISTAVSSPEMRGRLALEAYNKAKGYSWSKCAEDTLAFIHEIAIQKLHASEFKR